MTARELAQLVERQSAALEFVCSNPDRTTNQGLKITGKIMLAAIKTLFQYRLSRHWAVTLIKPLALSP